METIIEDIRNRLARQAVGFTAGGFRPAHTMTESWIGRVYLYKEDEEIPNDANGMPMVPLFQLCLEGLPWTPPALKDSRAITIFISETMEFDYDSGESWAVREYKYSDTLIFKDLANPASYFKPFPLAPKIIEKDFPVWDGGGMPDDVFDELVALESSGAISDYFDILETDTELNFVHKLGGYPTFNQPGVPFWEDFEFVLQIASDEKANINFIDNGTLFLSKNTKTGEWRVYCDYL